MVDDAPLPIYGQVLPIFSSQLDSVSINAGINFLRIHAPGNDRAMCLVVDVDSARRGMLRYAGRRSGE